MYIPGSMPEKTLYVIDATSLLFTTWFAKEHTRSNVIFTTRNGVDCRALAHMVGRLCYFMGTVRPNYIALTFDARNVIKRDLYPEYKATRKDVGYLTCRDCCVCTLCCVTSHRVSSPMFLHCYTVLLYRKILRCWRSCPWHSRSSRRWASRASVRRATRLTM
jgi:hypothetical protein